MSIKWALYIFILFCWNNYNLIKCENINETRRNHHYYRVKSSDSNSWITMMQTFRSGLKDCLKNQYSDTIACAKQSMLEIFDDALSSEVIPIWKGIKLVRMSRNSTGKAFIRFSTSEKKHISEGRFFSHLFDRIMGTFRSHLLQINIKELEAGIDSGTNETLSSTSARHRRHRNNMMIAMVFGVTALGAVIVPIGFQFLSVVSGKALLLAKMALLLASINGLKKVASSGVHYGLYQVPDYHNYAGGYYDRGDLVQQPRDYAQNLFSSNTTSIFK